MNRHVDPDQSLERLLRRTRPDAAQGPACIDAEQLAAWSDGSLPAAEHAAVEQHLSGCGRCQAVLSAFAQADEARRRPLSLWRRAPARWIVPLAVGTAATVVWMIRPAPAPGTASEPATTVARAEAPPIRPEAAPATGQFSEPAARESGRQDAQETQEARDALSVPREAAKVLAPAAPPAVPEAMTDRDAAPVVADEQTLAARRSASPTVEISAPDPAYRWRVQGGVVERSTTGGASWSAAVVPGTPRVTGGASPSPLVCWLIGPAGAVLRTVDGLRFELVEIAGAGDLTSIRTDDADRASVTAADGRTYTTADGGRSWR